MKYFRKFDYFGININFTTFLDDTFKTLTGSFISFLYLSTVLAFTLILGKDFFYRTNPKLILEKIIEENYQLSPLSNKNFTLAWRFEDYNSNRLFPKIKVIANYYYYIKVGDQFNLTKSISNLCSVDESSPNSNISPKMAIFFG